MVQAVIVAAGAGSRLFPITDVVPKIMIPVGKDEKPVALHIIKHCMTYGICDFVFCLNVNNGKQVENFFGSGARFGVTIRYSYSGKPLGTAGELWLAYNKKLLKMPSLVYYGDTLCSTDVKELMEHHEAMKGDVSIVVNDEIRIPVGYIEDAGGNIVTIKEKPRLSELGVANRPNGFNVGGILPIFYITNEAFYSSYCRPYLDVVTEVLPDMQKNEYRLVAYHDRKPFIDMGDWRNLKRAKTWTGLNG